MEDGSLMYSDWQAAARAEIKSVHESLPADATLKERRSALRKAAHGFHAGTSWGKKVWSRHCRQYLELHGLPKKVGRPGSKEFQDKLRKMGQADIIFPFRDAP